MQKAKFQIKGMHCNSCALLIEEKLKSEPGIIKVKTSYDSQKAVVVYDEQKIKESTIRQLIEGAGDYKAEKVEEKGEELQNDNSVSYKNKKEELQLSPEPSNSLKLLTSLVIISLGLNIASLVMLSKLLPLKENQSSEKFGAAIGQNLPSQNNPTNPQPSPDARNTAIQNFEITKDNHVRGDFEAPITLVEFSDFECPFCGRHFPTLNKILSDYKGKVRLVYKHFPLSFHPNAQKAAEASECASEQGKFWEYHDKLFENQTSGYSLEKFKQWARDLGLNVTKFNDCLDSGKYAQKVQADYQEGLQKGVNGTPATFVNGQLVSGALPYEVFKQIIDSALK
jgi:protein-disulfide isomerase/copper chaperone CopZ